MQPSLGEVDGTGVPNAVRTKACDAGHADDYLVMIVLTARHDGDEYEFAIDLYQVKHLPPIVGVVWGFMWSVVVLSYRWAMAQVNLLSCVSAKEEKNSCLLVKK